MVLRSNSLSSKRDVSGCKSQKLGETVKAFCAFPWQCCVRALCSCAVEAFIFVAC